jgi:ABC-type glycerol-3-phosphate transport system substrate-binding protein
MKLKRLITLVILVALSVSCFSGCFRKEQTTQTKPAARIELVFYNLFDNEDVFAPLIQQYSAKHPNVVVTYRKFTDPVEYENLIVNELAEGGGPDIFAAPNFWFLRNLKKITPLPVQTFSPQQFDQTFVSVASDNLELTDPADGLKKVYGIPLYVDTLALYYNKSTYEDRIPSRGRPAATWDTLKDDVFQLTKPDNSFERFSVAGIAMGRSDNISRAVDILYLLMLQFKTRIYNDNISQTAFANQQIPSATGLLIVPAVEALQLYTSYALPTNKNYSWNEYLASAASPVKEMETFARGKVAMIFGYSYLYNQILAEIKDLKDKGVKTIDPNDVRINAVPQVNDPATSTEKRVAYSNYYADTVSRTSQHPAEAWDFLLFISSKDNLQYYNSKTHYPSSRRDLLDDQKKDPIYGVFAEQTGYADSFPIYDYQHYQDIFSKAIDSVLATISSDVAIKTAADSINALLPEQGLLPAVTSKTTAGSTQQVKK